MQLIPPTNQETEFSEKRQLVRKQKYLREEEKDRLRKRKLLCKAVGPSALLTALDKENVVTCENVIPCSGRNCGN